MRVLYIEPLKKPRVIEIPLDLNSMQKLVLGPIQAIYPWEEDPLALVCNEVGLLENLPLNRVVGHDIIHGPFFICGIGTEDFCDLPEELIEKYMDQKMSLKASLSFKYFFENGWACAHTSDGCWIVTDEGRDLGNALIFPDEESFISWLEESASEHLSDDAVTFLRLFCSVPELITPEVAETMLAVIDSPDTYNEPRGSD